MYLSPPQPLYARPTEGSQYRTTAQGSVGEAPDGDELRSP